MQWSTARIDDSGLLRSHENGGIEDLIRCRYFSSENRVRSAIHPCWSCNREHSDIDLIRSEVSKITPQQVTLSRLYFSFRRMKSVVVWILH